MQTRPSAPKALPPFFVLAWALLAAAVLPQGLGPAPALAAGGENLGHVSRLQGAAFVQRGPDLLPLALNDMVRLEDVLKTAASARLELTMLDETRLTLGADTEFALARYDLGRQRGPGAVLLKLAKGAFRLATGELSALRGGPFEVGTPLGTIGIRGTDFWGGYLDTEEINVLLISGKGVYIHNEGGTTEIVKPGEGVTLSSATAPPPAPTLWRPAKVARAFKTVAFE